jgi:hypothetical protein
MRGPITTDAGWFTSWRINEHRWLWVPAQGRDDGAVIARKLVMDGRGSIKGRIMRDITQA